MSRAPHRRPFSLERIEPRILLSADALGGAIDSDFLDDRPLEADAATDYQQDPGAIAESLSAQYADHTSSESAPVALNLDGLGALLEQDPPAATRHELIVIDAGIADHQELAAGLMSDTGATEYTVVILAHASNGIEQLSGILDGMQELDAIHLISHGSEGRVQLGSGWLDQASLETNRASIGGWDSALAEGADLLIYGCDLAGNQQGQDLLESLAALTGADVAASDDATGAQHLSGDWDLEFQQGSIESGLPFTPQLMASWTQVLAAGDPIAVADSYTVGEDESLDSNDNWFDSDWSNRRTISFDNLARSEDISDAPVLVSLDGTQIDYLKTRNNGEDLRFVDSDGTVLAHQIETWNESGTSTVWVQVPQIDGSSGTDFIWMYYGNTLAADGQNASGVWSNAYQAVWHFSETSGNHADSTSNSYALQPLNGVSQGVASAVLGGANQYDGVDDYLLGVQPNTNLAIAGDVTLEAFINIGSNPGSGEFASIVEFAGSGESEPANYLYALLLTDGGDIQLGHEYGAGSNQFYTFDTNLSAGSSYHLGAVRDTAANEWSLYVNGVLFDSYSYTEEATGGSSANVWIGYDNTYFDGTIDEVRIADTARSADWISAQFESLKRGLASIGAEQSTAGVIGNDVDTDGDGLTASLVSGPANHAAFTLNSDGSFTYTPLADFDGTDSFTYKVNDGITDSNIATVNLTIEAANDPPTATNLTSTSSYSEDAATVDIDDIVVSDVDTVPAQTITATLTLSDSGAGILTTSGTATYNPVTGVWTISDSVSNVNAALASVAFVPAANYELDATLQTHIEDQEGAGPADGTITLDVTPVNDAPTTSDRTVITAEDTPYTFSAGDFNFADVDSGASFFSIEITAQQSSGRLELDGTQVSLGQVISKTDLDAGRLKYHPANDDDGSQTFGFTVNDGSLDSQAPATLTIDMTPSPDTPTANAGPDRTINEGELHSLTAQLSIDGDSPDLATIIPGQETGVNTSTDGDQKEPVIALAPDGSYVIIWEGEDADKKGVFGQRFSASGDLIGNEFQVNTTTGNDQKKPDVAVADDGSFVVVWEGQDADRKGVFGQRYSADGTPDGSEFPVNTATTGDQKEPRVTIATDGSFVVIYESEDSDQSGIVGQRFDASGNRLGGEFEVNTTEAGDQKKATIGIASNGSFVVTWKSPDANENGLFAQRFDSNATRVGGEFQVNTQTSGDQKEADIAVAGDGSFVIVWEGEDTDRKGVFAQRYDANGDPLGGEFQVNAATSGDQDKPRVASMDNGHFVVTWSGQDPDGGGIFAQRYDSNGSKIGTEFLINTDTSGNQDRPAIALNESADFVVAYQGEDADRKGVYHKQYVTDEGLTYSWVQLSGDAVALSDDTALWPGFTPAIGMTDPVLVFELTVDDGVGSHTDTVTMTVNRTPQATDMNSTATYTEDDLSVAIADIVVSDVDTLQPQTITATLTLSDSAAGSLTTNGGASFASDTGIWTITDSIANVNAALAALSFSPAANYDLDSVITVHIEDQGGLGPADGTINLDVNPVNDPLTGSVGINGTPSEDQQLTADASGLSDNDGLGALNYQWFRDGIAIGGATADTYTPGDSDVGSTISVAVSYTDNGATPTLESALSAGVGPIANVNDAPTTSSNTVSTPEDNDYLFTASDFNFTDVDAGDSLASIRITTLQSSGSLLLEGSQVSLNQVISRADIDAGKLSYAPAPNASGTAGFEFTVSDGALDSAVAATLSIDITAVNDPPAGAVLVTGTPTEDQTLTADVSGVSDIEGLGTFSYQWLRDGNPISGATGNSHTLGDADVGTVISVAVSYTDGSSNPESISSAGTTPISNLNDTPAGAVAITGIATEDQVLSADTSGITDDDGLGSFSYQWLRDGNPISGASSNSYTLDDADVGAVMAVTVSYTDGNGTVESLTSPATGLVANINDPLTGSVLIEGTVSAGNTLTANTGSLADDDGLGSFSYQWLRDGTPISGAIADSYLLGGPDIGASISVQVQYTDANGTAESATSAGTATVTAVNTSPTGALLITGTAAEDQLLTADASSIADADGLGAFSYEWRRDGTPIAGANADSYLPGDDDVGTVLTVNVRYTDGFGTAESMTSAGTDPIANLNDAPSGAVLINGTAVEDQILTADASAIADDDGLGSFSYQWLRDGSPVTGANSDSYTLGDEDVGAVMSVSVSYTDSNGSVESLASTGTAPIANLNDAPSGNVTVTGTPRQGQLLSADTSGIADDDGLGTFSYQWLRDGSPISGAISNSYTLGGADVGTAVSVSISYTDGQGTVETATSATTAPIIPANQLPTGSVTISGIATEDQSLSVNTGGIADADGLGSFSYQWLRNGSPISGAGGSSYTLGDNDVGAVIAVSVSYTDGNGSAESLTSAGIGPVANLNDAPTGALTISGTVLEDQVLTADTSAIADEDGLGSFSYQWLRDGNPISGATGATYTLGDDDVGTSISASVGYTDAQGSEEVVSSGSTAPVANIDDPLLGSVTIEGSSEVGQVLTANTAELSDEDGISALSYQWLRDGTPVPGATHATYSIEDADLGATLSVAVSITDGYGAVETLPASTGSAVIGAPGEEEPPVEEPPVEEPPIEEPPVPEPPAPEPPAEETPPAEQPEEIGVTEFSGANSSDLEQLVNSGVAPASATPTTPARGDDQETAPESAVAETAEASEEEQTDDKESGKAAQGVALQATPPLVTPYFSDTAPSTVYNNVAIDAGFEAAGAATADSNTNESLPNPKVGAVTSVERSESQVVDRLRQVFSPLAENTQWLSSGNFADGIDQLRDEVMEEAQLQKLAVGSGVAVTSGLSVGYVIWAARSGMLLSTVLSSLPAWRFVDPFPVLSNSTGLVARDDEDQESLESIASNTKQHEEDMECSTTSEKGEAHD